MPQRNGSPPKTCPNATNSCFRRFGPKRARTARTRCAQLLDSALGIVTDAPILKLQEEIGKQREKIAAARDKIAHFREKRLDAPESGLMPGILTDTQASINKSIEALEDDIKTREADIVRIKQDIGNALAAAGIELSKEKLDLLLDSVLGSHLLKLVTAFEVSKIADQKLAALLNQSNGDLKAARRYFAMHAALFAMLVEAQGLLIEQIDAVYLVRLDKITDDIAKTNAETPAAPAIANQGRPAQGARSEPQGPGGIAKSLGVL